MATFSSQFSAPLIHRQPAHIPLFSFFSPHVSVCQPSNISPTLLLVLTHINISLTTGTFPSTFIQARVTLLITKQNSILQTSSFSLSISQKKKKRIVSDHLLFSNRTTYLTTTTAQRLPHWPLLKHFCLSYCTGPVCCFDTVNHQILLSTISALGITGTEHFSGFRPISQADISMFHEENECLSHIR